MSPSDFRQRSKKKENWTDRKAIQKHLAKIEKYVKGPQLGAYDIGQGFPTSINCGPHTCQSGHKEGRVEQK